MSILHRRGQVRERQAELAAGKRASRPAEYPRASKSKGVPADVKARTWIDPEAPAPAAPPPVRPPRKKTARRK